jgi:hypothetical protein
MRGNILGAAIALAAPFSARAVEPGLEIALRTGFALPFGNVAGDTSSALSDLFSGFVPLGAELGWRSSPNLFTGMSGSYALGVTKNCPSTSCSGHDAAIGIEIRYHALPDERIDPWFGIGAGYEWLSTSQTVRGTTAIANVEGVEFVHAEAGADVATPGNVRVGPFIRFSLGQYRRAESGSGGTTISGEITPKALHQFLTLGVRMGFVL